jgi:ribose transport system substrate-binding protein
LGIGAKTVKALVDYVRSGKTPKPLIDTGFYYYDATNIEKPEIKGNLYQ